MKRHSRAGYASPSVITSNLKNVSTKSMPVRLSTSMYLPDILEPQARHFPLKNSQLKTGIRSYHFCDISVADGLIGMFSVSVPFLIFGFVLTPLIYSFVISDECKSARKITFHTRLTADKKRALRRNVVTSAVFAVR